MQSNVTVEKVQDELLRLIIKEKLALVKVESDHIRRFIGGEAEQQQFRNYRLHILCQQ